MKSFALAVIVMLSGCAGEEGDDDEGGASFATDSACMSGRRWTGGDSESSLMHPGLDCIGCHARGEGPRFILAGTIFGRADEPDDCAGIAGVTITITDAANTSVDLTSNSAGNFYLSARTHLVMPIHARIAFEGRERMMSVAQQTGACASCHTDTPSEALPGRIVAP